MKASKASKALQAVNYKKANIEEVAKVCNNLTNEQQTKLLDILKQQQQLFLKAIPSTSKSYNEQKPYGWSHILSYSMYRQCDIGMLCELTTEEIKTWEWASPYFGLLKEKIHFDL